MEKQWSWLVKGSWHGPVTEDKLLELYEDDEINDGTLLRSTEKPVKFIRFSQLEAFHPETEKEETDKTFALDPERRIHRRHPIITSLMALVLFAGGLGLGLFLNNDSIAKPVSLADEIKETHSEPRKTEEDKPEEPESPDTGTPAPQKEPVPEPEQTVVPEAEPVSEPVYEEPVYQAPVYQEPVYTDPEPAPIPARQVWITPDGCWYDCYPSHKEAMSPTLIDYDTAISQNYKTEAEKEEMNRQILENLKKQG